MSGSGEFSCSTLHADWKGQDVQIQMSNQFFQSQHYSTLVKLSECLVGEQRNSIKLVQKRKHDLTTKPFNRLRFSWHFVSYTTGCNHAVIVSCSGIYMWSWIILWAILVEAKELQRLDTAGLLWPVNTCFNSHKGLSKINSRITSLTICIVWNENVSMSYTYLQLHYDLNSLCLYPVVFAVHV